MSLRRCAMSCSRAIRVVALILLLMTAEDAVGAETSSTPPTTPSFGDICAKDDLAAPPVDDADKARKEALRNACLAYQMQMVSNLTSAAKLAPTEQALAAFAAMPKLTGGLSSPAAADHVGQALSQMVLAATVRSVASTIAANPKWVTLKRVLVIDQALMDARIQVATTTNWLLFFDLTVMESKEVLEATSAGINAQIAERKLSPAERARRAQEAARDRTGVAQNLESVTTVPLALNYIPFAISAAQAIAGTMKVDATLSAITPSAKYEVIFSSLASDPVLREHLYLPGANTTPTDEYETAKGMPGFVQAFVVLAKHVAEARAEWVSHCTGSARAGATADETSDISESCENVNGHVAEAQKLLDSYLKVPDGKVQSAFQEVATLAAKVAPDDIDALLVVTASSFGAHGGVSKSLWRSDRLLYVAETMVSYSLVDTDGATLDGGTVYGSGHVECGPAQDCLSKPAIAVSRNAVASATEADGGSDVGSGRSLPNTRKVGPSPASPTPQL